MADNGGTGRRMALVIGNASYIHAGVLKNPTNDAAGMEIALGNLGFDVVGGERNGIDLKYGALAARIRDFGRRLRETDPSVALLFYAGHGLQVDGRNYLVPVDAKLEFESDVGSELFELQHILNQMERPTRTSLVFLDACRDNPLAVNLARAMGFGDTRSAAVAEGLAEQKVVAGTLIAYATQPGHVAYDGSGRNGYFTEALIHKMATPGQDVELMLRDVRSQVLAATRAKARGPQVPWVHSSLLGSFSFKAGKGNPNPPLNTLNWSVAEWDLLKASDDVARLKRFADHANKYYAAVATDRIACLERDQVAAKPEALAKEDTQKPGNEADEAKARKDALGKHIAEGRIQILFDRDSKEAVPWFKPGLSDRDGVFRDLAYSPEMVAVPSGGFQMGSSPEEIADLSERYREQFNLEDPQHDVRIEKSFAAGRFAVTFDEWDAAVTAGAIRYKPDDNGWGRGRRPVINISWDDARAYVSWLTEMTGSAYRLLSEAEWEYCCRAGTTTAYSTGNAISRDKAQFRGDHAGDARRSVEVGSFAANAWGLHDMHGNICEWCGDNWHPNYQAAPRDGSVWQAGRKSLRVLRGGSWNNNAASLRSAARSALHPDYRGIIVGFRVAKTL